MLAVALLVAAQNIQQIRDWWFLRSYEPPAEIELLAQNAFLSDKGKSYFYMSDPQINNKEEFNQNCTTQEKALILGCYRAKQIFILQVDRQELDGIMEVTAAHEMLHAAYDRLPESRRVEIVSLLEEDFARIDDPIINDLIERYEERGGQEAREDELHSILPTQSSDLSDELEQYYDKYFDDRQSLVELYGDYEQTFLSIRDNIERLQQEVEDYRSEIEELEVAIESRLSELEAIESELEELLDDEDVESFNELVPRQNDLSNSYNQLVDQYRSAIANHNQAVEELNETVILRADLVNSLDSTYDPL